MESAQASADAAKVSEDNAKISEENSSISEENANISETNAANSANIATEKAGIASAASITATEKANEAINSANESKSYAVGTNNEFRENDAVDNSKYYYEQARNISEGLNGTLLPMGTITFSQLSTQEVSPGYMYNISDSFVTDSTFKDGVGFTYPEGTNIYYTADGYWDCLAGTNVAGVKGNAETNFRKGYINITPENIGLGNVEDKSSVMIREELTKKNVINALGYTPPVNDTNTWRPVVDNLDSTSASDSLSANQGRSLLNLMGNFQMVGINVITFNSNGVINAGGSVDVSAQFQKYSGTSDWFPVLLDAAYCTVANVSIKDSDDPQAPFGYYKKISATLINVSNAPHNLISHYYVLQLKEIK